MSYPEQRLFLFPITTSIQKIRGQLTLTIAGHSVVELAERFGTPLYIYDRTTLDASLAAYRQALSIHYPESSGITYAGKAFLSLAIAQWADQQGLMIDCTGAGEIQIAASAGVTRQHILVHGVNKSVTDLMAAIQYAGTIVVDNLTELDQLVTLYHATPQGFFPDLWLRLRPGIAVQTHTYTQTGQEDSKFGMSPLEACQAISLCRQQGLPLNGLHFHQGSHFHDPTPLGPAIETVIQFMAENLSTGWYPKVLCIGGGWGVPYHEDDLPHLPVDQYISFAAQQLMDACQAHKIPLPHLQVEPGRSLVASAAISVYRLGAVKQTATRRWLILDGGMADNPRPALYRSRYSALPVLHPNRPLADAAWLAGPYCESGDILIEALPMPEMNPGELIAIPVSGAYHISMSSNYNGACRPAVVWVDENRLQLILERETTTDLLRHQQPLMD